MKGVVVLTAVLVLAMTMVFLAMFYVNLQMWSGATWCGAAAVMLSATFVSWVRRG